MLMVEKLQNFAEKILGGWISPPKRPSTPGISVFVFFAWNFSKYQRLSQNGPKTSKSRPPSAENKKKRSVFKFLCLSETAPIFLTPPPPTRDEMAPSHPKTPISRAPGAHRTPNGVRWARIQRAIKFGWRAVHPERPPGPQKSTSGVFLTRFGPRTAAKFLQAPQTPRPPKTSISRNAAAGGRTVKSI